MYSARTRLRCRRPKSSIRSRHSFDEVFNAGGSTSFTPRSELPRPMPSPSASSTPSVVIGQVPRLPDHPGPGRMSGDPGHVHPSGIELDEEQHLEALQQHRVDREEVTGQHPMMPGSAGTPHRSDHSASVTDRCPSAAGWPRRSREPGRHPFGPARLGSGGIPRWGCLGRVGA
jgi:hypothetical protein